MKTSKGTCFNPHVSQRESNDLLRLWLCIRFLSLSLSFQVLLTLDDDLDVVRRDQIPVFWASSIKRGERERSILVLFHEKCRTCSKVTTAKYSTPALWSQLWIYSHREERSGGDSNLPGWRQQGSQGYGQRRALKRWEAPVPLCRNSELDMDNRCIKVNLLSCGAPPTLTWDPPAMAERSCALPSSCLHAHLRWAPFALLQCLLL